MTTMLEKALARASKLPDDEQDTLAAILLDEMASEARWQKAFADSPDQLAALAGEALEEFRAGKTQPLDADDV